MPQKAFDRDRLRRYVHHMNNAAPTLGIDPLPILFVTTAYPSREETLALNQKSRMKLHHSDRRLGNGMAIAILNEIGFPAERVLDEGFEVTPTTVSFYEIAMLPNFIKDAIAGVAPEGATVTGQPERKAGRLVRRLQFQRPKPGEAERLEQINEPGAPPTVIYVEPNGVKLGHGRITVTLPMTTADELLRTVSRIKNALPATPDGREPLVVVDSAGVGVAIADLLHEHLSGVKVVRFYRAHPDSARNLESLINGTVGI